MQITLGVSFDSDLEKVRQTVEKVVRGIPGVTDDPAPAILFDSFSDYSIKINALYWYNEAETGYGQALDAGVSGIKKAFDQEGITIPIPVHQIRQETGESSSRP